MKRFPFILNIVGLTIAFAAFVVILMQVRYDLGYDNQYANADRLYRIEGTFDSQQPDLYSPQVSRPLGQVFFDNIPGMEAGGVYARQGNVSVRPTGSGSGFLAVPMQGVTSPMLDVIGLSLVEGDLASFDQPNTALISQSMAQQLFPGQSAVGKSIDASPEIITEAFTDGQSFGTVVGVYKDFPKNASFKNGLFVNFGERFMDDDSEWSFNHYVRLAPTARVDSVEARLTRVLREMVDAEDSSEEEIATLKLRLNNLHQVYFSSDVKYDYVDKGNRTTTFSMITIAILLIAIAIINFINFTMAAVPMRIRSINTRKILGCTNAALRARQLLKAALTAFASYVLAMVVVYVLSTSSFTTYISADMNMGQNVPLLALCLVIALFTGLLAGLYPAFYSTSFTPALVLKGSFSLSPKGRRLRTVLIGFQYVISFVLIMVALFINVQSQFMKKYDMGFRSDLVVTLHIGNYASAQANLDAMESALRQSPDIIDVTFADGPLVSNGKMGWGRPHKGQDVHVDCFPVAPNFLDFFGLEMVEGRKFVESDRLKANGTIIFNQTAVNTYSTIKVGDKFAGHAAEPADVVGIVKDFNFQPLQYRINPIALYVFGSEGWRTQNYMYMRIVPDHVAQTFQTIRDILAPFMPQTNMAEQVMTFMDEGIGALYEKEDRLGTLILLFSFLSVFISIIGILGLIFFDTQFRRKEMAIRRVHGSSVGQILQMLNAFYLKLTGIYFLISLPFAIWIMRTWVRNFPYQAPMAWWIFACTLAALALITVAVITLQSFKTVSANPVDALSKE